MHRSINLLTHVSAEESMASAIACEKVGDDAGKLRQQRRGLDPRIHELSGASNRAHDIVGGEGELQQLNQLPIGYKAHLWNDDFSEFRSQDR
jgi:hypothetical protein